MSVLKFEYRQSYECSAGWDGEERCFTEAALDKECPKIIVNEEEGCPYAYIAYATKQIKTDNYEYRFVQGYDDAYIELKIGRKTYQCEELAIDGEKI